MYISFYEAKITSHPHCPADRHELCHGASEPLSQSYARQQPR